jgi:hypothetical protein
MIALELLQFAEELGGVVDDHPFAEQAGPKEGDRKRNRR